jgi:hypothetical protein
MSDKIRSNCMTTSLPVISAFRYAPPISIFVADAPSFAATVRHVIIDCMATAGEELRARFDDVKAESSRDFSYLGMHVRLGDGKCTL